MRDLNAVIEHGNLTRDPKLRFTNSGTAVVEMGLAVNHSMKRGNSWEDRAMFFDVVAFGQLAENIAESVQKGDRVVVAGRLDFEQWEDRESGAKRSKVKIVADVVAASMANAVVTVNRNERRAPASAANSPAPAYDPDEEPF